MKKIDRIRLRSALAAAGLGEWKDAPGPQGSVLLARGQWTVDRYRVHGRHKVIVSGPLVPQLTRTCHGRGWPVQAVALVEESRSHRDGSVTPEPL